MSKKGVLPKTKIRTRSPSKEKSSKATREKYGLKEGHTTGSGYTIGLTTDEQTHYRELLSVAVQDIITESAFTPEQKKKLIKQMPGMSSKDRNFYDFLNETYKTGPQIAATIAIMQRKETATTRGRLKARR